MTWLDLPADVREEFLDAQAIVLEDIVKIRSQMHFGALAYDREYTATHKPEIAAKGRLYRAANKDRLTEYAREWRAQNPTSSRAATARWRAKNREAKNAYNREWRARKKLQP